MNSTGAAGSIVILVASVLLVLNGNAHSHEDSARGRLSVWEESFQSKAGSPS